MEESSTPHQNVDFFNLWMANVYSVTNRCCRCDITIDDGNKGDHRFCDWCTAIYRCATDPQLQLVVGADRWMLDQVINHTKPYYDWDKVYK